MAFTISYLFGWFAGVFLFGLVFSLPFLAFKRTRAHYRAILTACVALAGFLSFVGSAKAAEPVVFTVILKDGTVKNGLVESLKVCKDEADKLEKVIGKKQILLISCQRASNVRYQAI